MLKGKKCGVHAKTTETSNIVWLFAECKVVLTNVHVAVTVRCIVYITGFKEDSLNLANYRSESLRMRHHV